MLKSPIVTLSQAMPIAFMPYVNLRTRETEVRRRQGVSEFSRPRSSCRGTKKGVGLGI